LRRFITSFGVFVGILLRNTELDDLDYVLQVEFSEENKAYIAQWERYKHEEIIKSDLKFHFIIEDIEKNKLGYIILFDLININQGYYIKRIALSEKSKGIGRAAIQLLVNKLDLENSLKLAVVENNARAIKSYQAAGFKFKSLTQDERNKFKIEVDNISGDCLVMEYSNILVITRR